MHCDCFKKIEDLISVDVKLPAKAVKIMSLENLYLYSVIGRILTSTRAGRHIDNNSQTCYIIYF